ncbi:MAG: D-glycero-beta-D-manno-heptose 1,7-bisphosphate 7-phosphatase [Gammaproteobacteria bacterium]|nr:D-glycero-beta-D-manno-heptose 1,7-bisphosphate 7-phosphatase [Gammaproteobacteria bacterium]MBU1656199.1 D-glycero-beta-D-manno-heptose 1,7-bisphosphate 7-phosphatase [Gammaproteobacteria bacterium]MBU1959764.1 D-glycero-beta-D-manno-heptose 1,7-bisphosphate 7-phosphatase [Gammaproteobacteria bacterium]
MKLIILDRDGVINEDSDSYIKSPDEWMPIPGSLEAIRRLNERGYKVAIATNQSGIARGYFDHKMLASIHEKMFLLLSEHGGTIDKVFYCPHGLNDECECRKPKPGLFHKISDYYGYPLEHVPAIGDSLRDLEAATLVGCQPILVLTGKGSSTITKIDRTLDIPIFPNLAAVVDNLLAEP